MRILRTRLLPGVAAAALLLAACEADDGLDVGQEDGVEDTDTDTDTDADTDADEADEDGLGEGVEDEDVDTEATEDDDVDATAGDVTIETAEDDELGTHLVDGDGHVLYLSVTDGPDESTCTGDCTALWQPVLVDGDPEAGEGIDEDLLGTFDREDDGTQVTYDEMPLYRFAADEPGEAGGHDIADNWYAVSPDGGPIGDAEIVGPPAEDEGDEDA